MFFFKTIILLVFIIIKSGGANINNNCPRFCKCDSYLQLNRAQCSSKNLINAEVDLSNLVQILDLSHNDITIITSKCFTNFRHLKYLNISNNALQTLEWNAFSRLRQLTEINLSNNRLEYLDERLFSKNKYLNTINLAGNKLDSLQNKPFLNNARVTELSLKDSQIHILQPQLFAGLTNLKHLDLSGNFLNNFNLEDFRNLPNLQEINLIRNFIKCDDNMKNKLKQLEQRGISVEMGNCFSETNARNKQKVKMSEKMIMTTPKTKAGEQNQISQWRLNLDFEETSLEEYNDDEFDFKDTLAKSSRTNEWLRFAPDAILCNKQNFALCQDYRSCLQDLNKAWHDQRMFKEQYLLNDIKFSFVMGMAVGIAVVVLVLVCALCIKRCLEINKSDTSTELIDDAPAQPLARPVSQLPLQLRRRQPRRRCAPPPRSLVRYEGPVAENFLSRLFGRPARHQYYRNINQNTVTLIRRLSQSNLFNNRLSQHFIDPQPTNGETNSPVVQESPPSAPSMSRAETPPPSYGDVVIIKLNDSK